MLQLTFNFDKELVGKLPVLKAYALSLCRNSTTAEDLVQEAVCKALAYRLSFVIGSNFEAWLFVILKNHWRSTLRKAWRDVEDPDGVLAKNVAVAPTQQVCLEAKETLALVRQLPHDFRAPLVALADGASYEEAADELLLHIGTVKSRVCRGRRMISGEWGYQ